MSSPPKYRPVETSRFKKGRKLARKQGLEMSVLKWCIEQLAQDLPLPPNWKDHKLTGNFAGCRECHIGGACDWLLVYEKQDSEMILYLLGTGSHTDVLGM